MLGKSQNFVGTQLSSPQSPPPHPTSECLAPVVNNHAKIDEFSSLARFHPISLYPLPPSPFPRIAGLIAFVNSVVAARANIAGLYCVFG